MLKDGAIITVECLGCGFEAPQDIRMLKQRVVQHDLVCSHCHVPVQDPAADLERVIKADGKPPLSRLRLRPIQGS
jgi:hypothetical protein